MAQDILDPQRRKFLVFATKLMAGIGVAAASIPFITALLPSSRTQSEGGPITVDISHLSSGEMMVVEWRGKPVWILKRTSEMISQLNQSNPSLRDPNSLVDQQPIYAHNSYRSIKPDYLVVIGVCTHLGCIPLFKPQLQELGPQWKGGFLCPCHGSRYDLAGRVYKDVPAPINLQVPPHHFLNDTTIEIGVEKNGDDAKV